MSFVHLCKADSFTILLLLPLLYVKCGMHLTCCINIRLILEKYASLAYGQKLLLLTLTASSFFRTVTVMHIY